MAFDLITPSDRRHSTLQKGFNLRWPLGNVQGESSPNGASQIYLCHSRPGPGCAQWPYHGAQRRALL